MMGATHDARMPFGRYRGRPLADLPTEYLSWLVGIGLRDPLRARVACEWAHRSAGWRAPDHECPVAGPVDGDVAAAIVEAGRRVLAAKHHPDVGGDLATMQAINATADRLLGGLPRTRRSAA